MLLYVLAYINLQAPYLILHYTYLLLGSQVGWVQISALPLISCMTLDGSVQLSKLCTVHGGERMLKCRLLPVSRHVPYAGLCCVSPQRKGHTLPTCTKALYGLVLALTLDKLLNLCMPVSSSVGRISELLRVSAQNCTWHLVTTR